MIVNDSPVSLEDLNQAIRSYFPEADLTLVQKAHDFAQRVHGTQKRQSGEPYMNHPRAVAQILTELKLDIPSICTALLHDTVEDTAATLPEIEQAFGSKIAQLVDGVTKLSKITFKTSEEKQAENFRKMVIAMAKDIRVVLVKLADRTHNMRTLEHLAPHKQRVIAQETLDIYAPIANRLGISSLKLELEDLCLRYLHGDIYYRLAQKVAKSRKERTDFIDEVTAQIQERLKEYDLHGLVTGRPKHFYSIYKKMERRNIDFEQVYDVIAFRIILDNITECYKALGVIHAAYKPVPGRFKDYIAIPKANKYQSLHTTVIGPSGDRIEIQIRTQDMHAVAEYGIAAHWKYKEASTQQGNHEAVEWVERLVQWNKDLKDPTEFLETVKTDLFENEVYIFTPDGDLKSLPQGSTPLDFAFSVHTDVGLKCTGAKVNGRIVPLKYKLKSGDTVEILTSQIAAPSKDWVKLVKTSKAKAKIRAFIKTEEHGQALKMGHDLCERELKQFGLSLQKIQDSPGLKELMQERNFKNQDDLYVQVGYGRVSIAQFLMKVVPKDVLNKVRQDQLLNEGKTTVKVPSKAGHKPGFFSRLFKHHEHVRQDTKEGGSKSQNVSHGSGAIVVGDLSDVLVRFGRCCQPIPGDPIVGFVTRGRGVTVHMTVCPKALESDSDRRIDVEWSDTLSVKRAVRIRVLSHDVPGILALMSQSISSCGVNIRQASIKTTKDKKAISHFEVDVSGTEELSRVLIALESKKGVIHVERLKN